MQIKEAIKKTYRARRTRRAEAAYMDRLEIAVLNKAIDLKYPGGHITDRECVITQEEIANAKALLTDEEREAARQGILR